MELEATAGGVRVERFASVAVLKHLLNKVPIRKDIQPLASAFRIVALCIELLLNLKNLLLKSELVNLLPSRQVKVFVGTYFAMHAHGYVGHHQNILPLFFLFDFPALLPLPTLPLANSWLQ